MCVLLENKPLAKCIWNCIRDSSGVFSTSSLVKISMISLISSLSLKLYLNSLVYDRNIFRSSVKVFGNLRKMLRNVRLAFGTILENLRKSSESGRTFSQNRQKRRHQYVYIIKHYTLARRYEFYVLVRRTLGSLGNDDDDAEEDAKYKMNLYFTNKICDFLDLFGSPIALKSYLS